MTRRELLALAVAAPVAAKARPKRVRFFKTRQYGFSFCSPIEPSILVVPPQLGRAMRRCEDKLVRQILFGGPR